MSQTTNQSVVSPIFHSDMERNEPVGKKSLSSSFNLESLEDIQELKNSTQYTLLEKLQSDYIMFMYLAAMGCVTPNWTKYSKKFNFLMIIWLSMLCLFVIIWPMFVMWDSATGNNGTNVHHSQQRLIFNYFNSITRVLLQVIVLYYGLYHLHTTSVSK